MMIQAHFGLQKLPFHETHPPLLEHQQRVLEMLLIHSQQGGLCLVLGESGTGKSLIKQSLMQHDTKRIVTPVINRTLHTYYNTLRILCDAFEVEFSARESKCERLLVEEAFKLYRSGKLLVPIIDDAHLMPAESLRKLRLLCEDFPRTHNLVLIGQPTLMHTLSLSVNAEIKNRVTYSEELRRLAPEQIAAFLQEQLEKAGVGANVFTEAALDLIVRTAAGTLRSARNLTLGALVEAVRDRTHTVDIKQVNSVLRQPHWRQDYDLRCI